LLYLKTTSNALQGTEKTAKIILLTSPQHKWEIMEIRLKFQKLDFMVDGQT
jgi:hypothetical protein